MREAKTSIERQTVADCQKRPICIQRRINAGMTRIPTARVTRVTLMMKVAVLLVVYLEIAIAGFSTSM
jgi:hypothetical protein